MVLFLGVACVQCDFDMKVADKKDVLLSPQVS